MVNIIEELENFRKNLVKKITRTILVAAVVILLSLIALSNFETPIFIYLIVATVVIAFVVIYPGVSKYQKNFKEQLMPELISQVGDGIHYEYHQGIDKSVVYHSKLFRRADRYMTEDLLYGKIEDVSFKRADVHMQEKHVHHNGKTTQTTYETFFKGKWFVFEFNKSFKGMIQVREGGSPYIPLFSGEKASRIKLESVDFNQKFKTYTSDEHEAFYVLTPPIMLRMLELERKYAGRIYFSFIDEQLHVAIYDNSDSFEAPIFSPINQGFINSQIDDLKIMEEIIKELKLNNKIFK